MKLVQAMTTDARKPAIIVTEITLGRAITA